MNMTRLALLTILGGFLSAAPALACDYRMKSDVTADAATSTPSAPTTTADTAVTSAPAAPTGATAAQPASEPEAVTAQIQEALAPAPSPSRTN